MATATTAPVGTKPPAAKQAAGVAAAVSIAANPGEYLLCDEPVELNSGRRTMTLTVRNTGDRAIQIGSHFHFFEVNRALDFDRDQAMGMRLNIPAGTTVRVEPGDAREVELVEIGGTKRAVGFNALVMGSVTGKWSIKQAIDRAQELEFCGVTPNGQTGGQK